MPRVELKDWKKEGQERAEGRRLKAIEIAIKLIDNGMSKEESAKFVGVDVSDLDVTE